MKFGTLLTLATTVVSVIAKKRKYDNYNPSASQIAIDAQTAKTAHITSNVAGKAFNRFVVIWLENTNFDKAAENSDMEWLASQGIVLDNYWAITHPSEPNYMASVGGDYFALDDDRFISLPSNVSTIVDLLDTKGISWAEYQEHLPYTGYNGFEYKNQKTFGNDYVRKHNPLVLFESVNKNEERMQNIKNFTTFQDDLDNEVLPQWSFVTPNMTNDGHDSNINVASSWSRNFLTPLLNNEYFMKDTLILLTFDENENYCLKNRVYALLLGGAVPEEKKGTIDHTFYDHYSEISTVEVNWDLPNLGRNDVDANVFDIVASVSGIENEEVDTTYKVNNQTYTGYLNDDTIDLPAPNVNAKGKNGKGVLDSISSVWAEEYSRQISESYFTSTTTTAVWSIGDATTTAESTSNPSLSSTSVSSSASSEASSSFVSFSFSTSTSLPSSSTTLIGTSGFSNYSSSTFSSFSSFPQTSSLSASLSSPEISSQSKPLESSSATLPAFSSSLSTQSFTSSSDYSVIFSSSSFSIVDTSSASSAYPSTLGETSKSSPSSLSSTSSVTSSSGGSSSPSSSTSSVSSLPGASSTPSGLNIITEIELTDVRTHSTRAYLYDWFNVAVTFSTKGPISSNSIVQFTIPKEFIGPKPLTLRTSSGHLEVASTEFNAESGLYTIQFNSWGSSKRNIKGTFEFTVRLSDEALSTTELGPKSFEFQTVSQIFTETLEFSKIDRTKPWKQGIFGGENPFWQIEIPGALGPWSAIDISSVLQSLNDYYYDLSSVIYEIGSEFDKFGNITTKRSSNSQDYSTSGSAGNLGVSYTGSINSDEVLRITVPGIKQNANVVSFTNSFDVSINSGRLKRAVEDFSLGETLDTESVAVTDVVTSDEDPIVSSDSSSRIISTSSALKTSSIASSVTDLSTTNALSSSTSELSFLSGTSSTIGSTSTNEGSDSISTAIVSNGQTTVITVTSCSAHNCVKSTADAIATIITSTINNEVTFYTTYCPLSTYTTNINGEDVTAISTVTEALGLNPTSYSTSSTVLGSAVMKTTSTAIATVPVGTGAASVPTVSGTNAISIPITSVAGESTNTIFTPITVVESGNTFVSSTPVHSTTSSSSSSSSVSASGATKKTGSSSSPSSFSSVGSVAAPTSSLPTISDYAGSAAKVTIGQFGFLFFGLVLLI